jgi:hypothetical protein
VEWQLAAVIFSPFLFFPGWKRLVKGMRCMSEGLLRRDIRDVSKTNDLFPLEMRNLEEEPYYLYLLGNAYK